MPACSECDRFSPGKGKQCVSSVWNGAGRRCGEGDGGVLRGGYVSQAHRAALAKACLELGQRIECQHGEQGREFRLVASTVPQPSAGSSCQSV